MNACAFRWLQWPGFMSWARVAVLSAWPFFSKFLAKARARARLACF